VAGHGHPARRRLPAPARRERGLSRGDRSTGRSQQSLRDLPRVDRRHDRL
jgi:hypothetical protein